MKNKKTLKPIYAASGSLPVRGRCSMKEKEYLLLDAIAEDPHVTQASLAKHLGFAVGSVNWYIKRLMGCGYLKAISMGRTRLMYNLTPEGVSALTLRASQYMKDSLDVYKELREEAKGILSNLRTRGGDHLYLEGNDEAMDIMRLTCIEAGIQLDKAPAGWVVSNSGRVYHLRAHQTEMEEVGERR